MNLFEILSFDERVLVYSDVGNQVVYTWNRSITLQAWRRKDANGQARDAWEEVDVQTLSDEPGTYEKAREAAIKWSQA